MPLFCVGTTYVHSNEHLFMYTWIAVRSARMKYKIFEEEEEEIVFSLF